MAKQPIVAVSGVSSSRIVFGVDPGISIGFVVLQDGEVLYQETLPSGTGIQFIAHQICSINPRIVIVEDFTGAGIKNRESNATLKQVGFFEQFCVYYKVKVLLRQAQQRKAFEATARTKLKESKCPTPHEVSALAHVLSVLNEENA